MKDNMGTHPSPGPGQMAEATEQKEDGGADGEKRGAGELTWRSRVGQLKGLGRRDRKA